MHKHINDKKEIFNISFYNALRITSSNMHSVKLYFYFPTVVKPCRLLIRGTIEKFSAHDTYSECAFVLHILSKFHNFRRKVSFIQCLKHKRGGLFLKLKSRALS